MRAFPNAKIQTEAEFKKNQEQGIDTLLNLLYVLLSLSIIVSLFGIVNTLLLSVFERTRELGMLRAVGMTRRQLRSMIRHESIVTALIGAALGIPLGILLALMVGQAIEYPAFTRPGRNAGGVRAGGRRLRAAGGDLPGAPGGAHERAGGAAVRVAAAARYVRLSEWAVRCRARARSP